ncbi:MAG TPA: glycosyltransferase family 39 protein [Anaerolineales bacterium]|nr:glycosyltransferase family 39 protein [Anaerolineales bacterium]
MEKIRPNAPILAILLLALTLRSIGIFSRPIWYDEAFSLLLAEKGPSEILNGTLLPKADSSAAEEHPPLYYFSLWGWMKVFGASIPAARAFSLSMSVAGIALLYLIASELFDQQTAITAAILSAILPFQIHFAQEVRMYALLTLWLMLTTLAFLRARNQWKWWIVFSIFAALAQYTHNLAAVYLIPLALTPLFQKDWKTLRPLILAGLCSLILYLPWGIHLPAQLTKVSAAYWVERPGVEKIFTLFLFYLPHVPLSGIWLAVGLLLAVLIIFLAGFQTYFAKKNHYENLERGLWVAYLSFAPPLLLWGISQFMPVYVERALLPAHAIFCIWLAWALTQTKFPKPLQFFTSGMIFTVAAIGFFQHVTYNGFPYAPYAELNAYLESKIEPGDLILHSSKLSYLPAFYDDPTLPQGFILDAPGSNVDTLAPATRQIFGLTSYATIAEATQTTPRIWFIIFQNSIDEYTASGETSHPQLEYLNSQFTLVSVENWGGLRLYQFEKKR